MPEGETSLLPGYKLLLWDSVSTATSMFGTQMLPLLPNCRLGS